MLQLIKSKHAFTLLELAIVLVVTGLILGGIVTGRTLVRSMEVRSIITQHETFFTATMAFREKFGHLPGDMPNAASLWGAADGSTGSTAGCATTIGTGTQTCNGGGNGIISRVTTSSNEAFRFWQHLANAGLIGGTFTGVTDGSTTYSATSRNVPTGRIANSGWDIVHLTASGNAYLFDNYYGNTFEFGTSLPNNIFVGPVFTSRELLNLDTKLDDGKPATGKVVLRANNALSECSDASGSTATQAATLTASYRLTGTTPQCAVAFRDQF